MERSIADIRRDYSQKILTEAEALPDPVLQFGKWWDEAIHAKIDEVNAMTVATASPDGLPSARIMLLKGFDRNGFLFFTNYESYKGRQLAENPKACLVFFWKELERQVRVTGLVEKADEKESDAYFKSRPESSQVGALVSPQSRVIESRHWLDDRFNEIGKQIKNKPVNRPDYWGGYLLKPVEMEFWQGRPSRLHDRLLYSLKDDGSWKIERLAP